MSSATMPSSDRVRQIAILVSSVDATAARQLLLHLPTELAKQVRALASQLGPISALEKRKILAAFQQSTASSASEARANASPTPAAAAAATTDVAFEKNPNANRPADSSPLQAVGDTSHQADDDAPAWTKLSTEALVRFAKGERVAIVAVVISQLAPKKAVDVLQQLPRDINHAVIKRLSQLQDIDPTASAEIDAHLVERLGHYQETVESEHQSARRMSALFSVAPAELQQEWARVLNETEGLAPEVVRKKPSFASERSTEATIAELYGDAVITTDSLSVGLSVSPTATPPAAASTAEEQPDVIPFPSNAGKKAAAVDRVLLHAQFERILTLPAQDLAFLLSNIDSKTVLLAFAGASPEFMQRFTRMLKPADGKAFVQRLQTIGPMNLRDVDGAQERIVEQSAALLEAQATRNRRAA